MEYYNSNSDHAHDDDSDTESFESAQSALCETGLEMFNDVLCHAVIPEEEEVSFSKRTHGEDNIHPSASRGKFLTTKRICDQTSSFASCRSTATSTIGSSFLLSVCDSVANSSIETDDDLSIMTDLSYGDEHHLLTDSSDHMLSMESSANIVSLESSINIVSLEASANIDPDTRITYSKPISKTPRVNSTKISHERNILGHGGTKNALDLSDLAAALVSPSIQRHNRECSTTLDCSDLSEKDPSLSSLSNSYTVT